MEPPSYMRSVVDRNVVMRCMTGNCAQIRRSHGGGLQMMMSYCFSAFVTKNIVCKLALNF